MKMDRTNNRKPTRRNTTEIDFTVRCKINVKETETNNNCI